MNHAISDFLHAAIHALLPKIIETAENGELLSTVKSALADPAHCLNLAAEDLLKSDLDS